ncbi:MAG: flavodoxin family protein [Chloroflexota bacterium]
MKVTAIVGSPRPAGNTSYLVDRALQEIAARGFETEKIILSQHRVNPCLGHDECVSFSRCTQKDDAPWILDKFAGSDGVILGSPVYYYDITAQMKAFVDRNYFLYTHGLPLKALCAGLIVVAADEGIEDAVSTMMRFLKSSANIPDERIMPVTGYANRIGDVKNNDVLVTEAQKLGTWMAEMLLSAQRPK